MGRLLRRPLAAWRELPRASRIAVAVVGGLLVLNLLALIADAADRSGEEGPPSAATSTTATGTAAYASLLERFDHPVEQLTDPLSDAEIDPAETLVVLDPDALDDSEVEAVREFASAGGRLLIGGVSLAPNELVVGDPPAGSPEPADPDVGAQVAAIDAVDVAAVRTAGLGSWRPDPDGGPDAPLLVSNRLGSGQVLLVADPSAVQNAYLGAADNAGFALALAGPPGRPVRFAESVHGAGGGRGLGAIPGRWQVALIGTTLAALLWLGASARRLGAPDGTIERPAPPRREYVEARGALLARTGSAQEVATALRRSATEALSRRRGSSAESPEALTSAAIARGATEDEADALVKAGGERERLVGSGRALAAIAQSGIEPEGE